MASVPLSLTAEVTAVQPTAHRRASRQPGGGHTMTVDATRVCSRPQVSSRASALSGRTWTAGQLRSNLDSTRTHLFNGAGAMDCCSGRRRGAGFVVRAATKGFGSKPDSASPKKASSPAKTAQLDSLPQGGPAKPKPASAPSQRQEEEDDVIPEVVTDRILRRLVVTVGIPLLVGVAFFPLFYYLKVVQKVDIPEWLPLVTSSMTFGLAGLGISYGVISTSWDPQREGSLLGWKEAKANLPVFTQTLTRKKR